MSRLDFAAQEHRALTQRLEFLDEYLSDLETRSELRFTGELEALEAEREGHTKRLAQLEDILAALGGQHGG